MWHKKKKFEQKNLHQIPTTPLFSVCMGVGHKIEEVKKLLQKSRVQGKQNLFAEGKQALDKINEIPFAFTHS